MLNKIKTYMGLLISQHKINRILSASPMNLNVVAGNLIRNVHSIEKGMCVKNTRFGYGHAKIEEMLSQINMLANSKSEYHKECLMMAVSVLDAYLEFHKAAGYEDEFNEKLLISIASKKGVTIEGGYQEIHKDDLTFDTAEIERFFRSRHSIRELSDEAVCREDITRAFKLAQCAPSACNRQATRVYIFEGNDARELGKLLPDIGGFADDVPSFGMITAKFSSYRDFETFQYVVSPSIFVGYFSLALHLYGMGSCIIQRPVTYTAFWDKIKKSYSVPDDEQLICLMAIGRLKDQFRVPFSHRLQNEERIKVITESPNDRS